MLVYVMEWLDGVFFCTVVKTLNSHFHVANRTDISYYLTDCGPCVRDLVGVCPAESIFIIPFLVLLFTVTL